MFQASAAYRDDLFFSTENNPIVAQDAYTLINGRIGFSSASGQWGVALYGKNLGDEGYFTNVIDLTDFGYYSRTVAPPRTYGIELNLDF